MRGSRTLLLILGMLVIAPACRQVQPVPRHEERFAHLPTEPAPQEAACPAQPCEPMPLPDQIVTDWRPPGIGGPWPHDEYLCDGGDHTPQVQVNANWEASGLDLEDTVAHFDTIQGETRVQESNRVCIYSPRFAAVRQVTGVEQGLQREQLAGAQNQQGLSTDRYKDLVASNSQPQQALGDTGVKLLRWQKQNQFAPQLEKRTQLAAETGGFLPYEDFRVIRSGHFDAREKGLLDRALQNAVVWTDKQSVQVLLDQVEAITLTGDQKVQVTYTVDLPQHPKLRLIKVASTNQARPGDEIDFTIRFDNVGDQAIGNVTILDNLTPRLEYLEGTAKASRDADFATGPNQADSVVLRWEFKEPLAPGEGGVVRFHCKVR